MTKYRIDKATLIDWLGDGLELAVLDIRSAENVGYASPLFATNLPTERLEAELDRFVPRRAVRMVLVDGGDGTAEAAVSRLRQAGWTDIHFLEGGIPAWVDGGKELPTFDIPGVPFVTKVREERQTPVISAAELQTLRDQGTDVIVLDTRTLAEYEKAHVPGAVGVPGAELLLRFKDLVPSAETKVVVSCAGLPRAILGAQTLIDAGVANAVSYLDDGTRGWTDAGFELETGRTASYGDPSEEARQFASERGDSLSASDGLTFIDRQTAERWNADPSRTTYLLDVRTPEEFARANLAGSISSEGGQLLGVAYRTIAVRGARVVLVDDLLGSRARIVAHWLARRGYEITILLHDFDAEERAAA
ncbi:thiosulfate sulfurtransferase (plasmid) [Rhizobium grahamii]|uniref:Thiosulfate sulfurtransferase n=1 Tax=Rhizobium grahamii TaxID=1120045 RepID=A0A5Q0CGY3_9HYPH|nr:MULTISPECIES: rhodanese-like domain-containing protein [Rhizobium]QFY63289.1 thiosulfate sulfurtransferase [Rhizobium grahamii]QRM51948.1 thiosulfate sulfurtransferase [Rhizobium sp. BG6]